MDSLETRTQKYSGVDSELDTKMARDAYTGPSKPAVCTLQRAVTAVRV